MHLSTPPIMASLEDPVLHQPAAGIPDAVLGTVELSELSNRLNVAFDFYFARRLGVGLAAPQIGLSVRMCVAEDFGRSVGGPMWHSELVREPFERLTMCNPEVLEESAERQVAWETCLSEPQVIGLVARPLRIIVRYREVAGAAKSIEATGWQARILCHEIDHLDGCLCSRHYLGNSAVETPTYTQRWRDRSLKEAVETLAWQGKAKPLRADP